MTFKDHFSRLAAQYCAFRPSYPPSMFEFLAQRCADRRCAWDCACGSGQATVALARHFDSVIGTDASAQQIAAAHGHPNVTYRVAGAESSGLPSGSVALVTVAQALHWLALDRFYAEVERVLRSEGVLAVWAYGTLRVADGEIDELVQHFYGDTLGPYWPAERRLVEAGYRGLPFPFPEIAAPPFEMRENWGLGRLMGYLRTWSATGRYVEQMGRDPVAALEETIAPLWGDSESTRAVSWPLAVRLGRKC